MTMTIEWTGTLDLMGSTDDGHDAEWPARVERDADGAVRLVIAADGDDDYSQSVRPTRCRDAQPPMPIALVRELVTAGELDVVTMGGYQVQVTGEWGGSVDGWRPAIAGTLNQTGQSDAWASTCDSHEAAAAMLDDLVQSLTSDPQDGDPRDNAPRFRIVEVA